jgi:two-component system sensor histidine kinase DesK
VGPAGWTPRRTRWLVAAVHIAFIVPASVLIGIDLHQDLPWPPYWAGIASTLPLGLVLLALQLRLTLAFAAGEQPRGALWLLLAEVVLVYLPMRWLGLGWFWMQACLMASAPMVLRRWPAAVVVATVLVGSDLVNTGVGGFANGASEAAGSAALTAAFWVVYTTVVLALPAAGLYGSAWLVRLFEALRQTRAELAAVAVGRERLRVARDLHDLLGQSLSAVSLKGDLAIRLLASDPAAARDEIDSLTGVARDAIRGIRSVSRDEHAVSLDEETRGGTALLAAAGVHTRVDLDLPDLPSAIERLLAWAVREGVTNALRHSQARTCSISGRRRDGIVDLEVVNDGVSEPVGEGSGLSGLAERATALGGSVSAGPAAGGFRLLVEIPERAP